MAKRIVKKGEAAQGESIVVEARMPAAGSRETLGERDDLLGAEEELGSPGGESLALSEAEEIVASAESRAKEIIAAARAEAERVLAQAKADADAQRARTGSEIEARRESLERDVRAQVQGQYSGRYAEAVGALENAASDLRRRQEEYLASIERPAYELVLAIARQLLLAEPGRSPALIAGLIAHAFHLLKPEQVLMVHVSPTVFERLTTDELLASALTGAGIRWDKVDLEFDENLRNDQFIAEVNGASVSFDLESALARMADHLGGLESGAEPVDMVGGMVEAEGAGV